MTGLDPNAGGQGSVQLPGGSGQLPQLPRKPKGPGRARTTRVVQIQTFDRPQAPPSTGATQQYMQTAQHAQTVSKAPMENGGKTHSSSSATATEAEGQGTLPRSKLKARLTTLFGGGRAEAVKTAQDSGRATRTAIDEAQAGGGGGGGGGGAAEVASTASSIALDALPETPRGHEDFASNNQDPRAQALHEEIDHGIGKEYEAQPAAKAVEDALPRFQGIRDQLDELDEIMKAPQTTTGSGIDKIKKGLEELDEIMEGSSSSRSTEEGATAGSTGSSASTTSSSATQKAFNLDDFMASQRAKRSSRAFTSGVPTGLRNIRMELQEKAGKIDRLKTLLDQPKLDKAGKKEQRELQKELKPFGNAPTIKSFFDRADQCLTQLSEFPENVQAQNEKVAILKAVKSVASHLGDEKVLAGIGARVSELRGKEPSEQAAIVKKNSNSFRNIQDSYAKLKEMSVKHGQGDLFPPEAEEYLSAMNQGIGVTK